ncbi:hypothetical protein UA08_04987 [Talaromyces atroroseus]|uniref:Uncharacterized protein n=1 Tax=Talaromyces atroroseus TaxID=1441469 RepID=A0A225AYI8_TALAT|nr:hypothetical protein UA08_04987 [Talaromyces atroroseus]OKL59535.1 hypothetical protein UA08_04987 [Talaromyces atroroseus]
MLLVLSSNKLQHLNSITRETYDFNQYGLLIIRAYTRAQLADSSIITLLYSGELGYAEIIGEVTKANTLRLDRMGLGSSWRPDCRKDGQVVSLSNRPEHIAVKYNDNNSIDDIDMDGVGGDDIQSNHEPMHGDPEPHLTVNSGPPAPEHIGDDDALIVDSINPKRDKSGASGPPVPECMSDDDALIIESANPKRDELGASGPPALEHIGDDDAPIVESANPKRDELGAPRPPTPEHIGDDDTLMVESANPKRDKLDAPGPPAPEHLGNRPTHDIA